MNDKLIGLYNLNTGDRFRFPETREGTYFTITDDRKKEGSWCVAVVSNHSVFPSAVYKDSLVIPLP